VRGYFRTGGELSEEQLTKRKVRKLIKKTGGRNPGVVKRICLLLGQKKEKENPFWGLGTNF